MVTLFLFYVWIFGCEAWDLSFNQGSNMHALHWKVKLSHLTARDVPKIVTLLSVIFALIFIMTLWIIIKARGPLS